jgi:hypothetical protein
VAHLSLKPENQPFPQGMPHFREPALIRRLFPVTGIELSDFPPLGSKNLN